MFRLVTSLKLALKNLRYNKRRTFLSLAGIIIGIVSVIVVLSLGQGVKGFVVGQVESFGSDIIQIEAKIPAVKKTSSQNASSQLGGTKITTLKLDDAEEVAKNPNISGWYAMSIAQQVVSFGNKNKQSMVMGMTAGVIEADKKSEVVIGRFYSEEEDKSLKQVAVLGSEVKETFFGPNQAVGENIKIKGQTFQVIGVLKSRGMTGLFNYDNTIYVPERTLQKKILGIDYIQAAVFKLKDMDKLDLTILDATDVLRRQHDITDPKDDDFAVNSIAEVKDMLDKVFGTLNILLLALTSISLIVGGVGIMNVMYVSVSERTSEIGLRKSVGANSRDVLRQFLFEAIFLTLVGGIIGIIIGGMISAGATYLASRLNYSINFTITSQSIVISLAFSLVTGVFFGLYPARKAAKISPMEALRHE